jgi:hypothetical protein
MHTYRMYQACNPFPPFAYFFQKYVVTKTATRPTEGKQLLYVFRMDTKTSPPCHEPN